MSDTDHRERIRQLEAENTRLRRLLHQQGMPSTLRHQVRNALGLMRAILRRSAESKSTVEDFAAHVEGRFDALLRVQTMLLSSPDGKADLFALVSNELMAHAVQADDRATVIGDTHRVDARTAELLGLVLHELVTNALKFGALTVRTGHIEVSWRTETTPSRLVLTWAESGRRRTEARPSFRGFGMETIEGMLPYQLKAESTVEFLSEGLRCTLALPVASESSLTVATDA